MSAYCCIKLDLFINLKWTFGSTPTYIASNWLVTKRNELRMQNIIRILSEYIPNKHLSFFIDRDSSVGIPTCYGLDGQGIESRWKRDFPARVQNGPGAHPATYTTVTLSFPEVKRPGRGVDHPPHLAQRFEERVQLYLYSPSGRSWPVLGWTLLY